MIEFIRNLRSTERGRTIFKFILYLVFFSFAVVIIFIGNISNQKKTPTKVFESQKESTKESTVEKEHKEELTYLEKQNKLYNSNYDFVYTIKGSIDVVYEGTIQDGITQGFKETTDTLIHYTIENGITYKHSFKEKQEFNELYQNLDETLFDLQNLFNNLNQTSSTIMYKDSKKIYSYRELEGYTIEVTTDPKSILSINIKNSELEYNFEFTY